MSKVSFKNNARSTQTEIMDDFNLSGNELEVILNDLRIVNSYLGGKTITLNALSQLVRPADKDKEITIIDIGCGDGEMLRVCSDYGRKNGYKFKFIGVDANAHIIKVAKEKSAIFKNIQYFNCDIFSETFDAIEFDVALCTLFLHHFSASEIDQLLKKISRQSKVGVIVNDLQRSWIAFQLFKVFSKVFLKSAIAKHDGLVSVARAFKRKELEAQQAQLKYVTSTLQWKWAFRWQWILKKNN